MDVTFDPNADGRPQILASGIHARECECRECKEMEARAWQEYDEGMADADRLLDGDEDEGDS